MRSGRLLGGACGNCSVGALPTGRATKKYDWVPAPLYCRIGREKTTKSKNKDRVAYVSIPSLES